MKKKLVSNFKQRNTLLCNISIKKITINHGRSLNKIETGKDYKIEK